MIIQNFKVKDNSNNLFEGECMTDTTSSKPWHDTCHEHEEVFMNGYDCCH